MSIDAIKQEAQRRVRELVLVGELGMSDGRVEGIHWKCRNPSRHDKTIGSFVVDIGGQKPGRFMEFAAGDSAKHGEGGDIIDLVSYCLSGPGNYKSREARIDAIRWLAKWTGLDDGDGGFRRENRREREEREARIKQQETERLAREAGEAEEKARAASDWWLKQGKRQIRNTPVWRYLTVEREIPLHMLNRLPGALRFLPQTQSAPAAMFSAMAAEGAVRAVHLTRLTPDGKKHPTADPVKMMWGDKRGACVRIAKGEVPLSPEKAAEAGRAAPLAVCEGIEDALTLMMIYPRLRIWAAGDVGNLRAVADRYGWPGCASEVILVKDNDAAGSKADAAFSRAQRAWLSASAGRRVSIMQAVGSKDINDAWKQAGGVE